MATNNFLQTLKTRLPARLAALLHRIRFSRVGQTVIGIDMEAKILTFYAAEGSHTKKIAVEKIPFSAKTVNEDFFLAFGQILQTYLAEHPEAQTAKTTVILPDHFVVKDMISLPPLRKGALDKALDVEIEHFYPNRQELKINSYAISKNKQHAVYYITGVRKDLLASLYSSLSTSRIPLGNVTYAASATASAVFALAPKYKGGSYLLLDIKERAARFAFVAKGKTVGANQLPFGYQILTQNKLAPEDLLFDHVTAEVAVLNAKEKARAKRLTMMEEDIRVGADGLPINEGQEGEEEAPAENAETAAPDDLSTQKIYAKKAARKLPKFMTRDFEQTPEGFAYENFRLFVKWALLHLRDNGPLTAITQPDYVLVRMPKEFAPLIARANEEEKENGVAFRFLSLGADEDPTIAENLELYGGFFADLYNKSNNF